MIEQWHELTLEPGPRPALVLDASESAAKLTPYLRSLADGVLELLSETTRPRLFFLGNPHPHDPAEFPTKGEGWFRENAGRGSFISPIFEALEAEPDLMVAVAGAGRIFDLRDWRGHPLADRTIWLKIGPDGLTDGAYHEETYTCEQLAERLNNPTVRIEIGGPGVMPFAWDDAAFRWEAGRLVGSKTSGTLRFGVLTPEPDRVTAAVVMSNQTRRELRLDAGSELLPPEWVKMPHGEYMLLKQCLNKNWFQCPICQQHHAATALRCPTTGDLPLFPTLEEQPKTGFILLDAGSWEPRVRPHPSPVLVLGPETVAVRSGPAAARILRYDPAADSWTDAGAISRFHAMEDKRYALVL